ncbi:HK97-gp10 family putative phage morphogenesis protein [Alteribacillus sp. YIM 98480]|uniref:HK97-gp10 family putative phage morphogenesis protein n=1 Tax=Alteribacillus sp. YIM 98480 TaxID=2606599 RepID=UPI00131EC7E3|nr:HK97-gp10 family putative phage morphogenesis protein [Alteribacillus sp. YIM 98480]
MKVEVKGLDETVQKIQKWTKAKQTGVKDVVSSTAKLVETAQKSKVAYLSGETKDSITTVTEDNGFTTKVGPQKPDGFRAHWIELGTVNHPAQPFVRPSAEMNRPKFLSDLTKEFNKP